MKPTLCRSRGPTARTPSTSKARRALGEAELALRNHVHEVARLRHTLPDGLVLADYSFTEGPLGLERDEPALPVMFRGLFGDHDALVVYHLMFHPDDDQACPMCSLWVDGLHGVSHHISRRAALAVHRQSPAGQAPQTGRAIEGGRDCGSSRASTRRSTLICTSKPPRRAVAGGERLHGATAT